MNVNPSLCATVFCGVSDVSETPLDIFEGIEGIPEDYKAQVLSYVRRRLAPQPIKIRADVEVSCFTYEGM